MKKSDISLIINCKKEDIELIDMSYFNDKYERIYFNINPSNVEYLNKIINDIETKYYSIWDFNEDYKNIYNLNIYQAKTQNIDISILIPVYNCEKYIKECLDSCLNQDFKGSYEIIIVDDGSTDNTVKLIKEYKDSRIRLYLKQHSGISNSLNCGLERCKGKYICRMDGDDVMYTNRLTYQYNYMQKHSECDLLASNIDRYIDNEIYKYAPSLEVIKKNISVEDLFNKETHYNFICHPAICFKRELYEIVKENDSYFYNSEFDLVEDYELYLRLIKNYDAIINVDKVPVLKYNIFRNSDEKEKKLNIFRNQLFSIYCKDIIQSYTICIYYIATGIYKNDFTRFLLSVKNFFPNNHKTIVLISDGLDKYNNYEDENDHIKIKVVHINDYPWPINTLFKMKYISDNIVNADYIFYFNANCEILPIKTYCWFDKDKLMFAYHKDWFNNNCNPCVFCEAYMDNPNSTSYIGTNDYTYIQGAFFGGPSKKVYQMCKTINEMIIIDLQNNIIPRYHDETYLNKYNYLYNDAVISKILISEIWYNKNDLSNIDNTQFILMHENIYNINHNNKANKFEYVIPHNLLKPLYNYENTNIYDFRDIYKSYKIEKDYKDKTLILFYVKPNITNDELDAIILITKILKQYYEFIILYDSRTNKEILNELFQIYDSNHIFSIDVFGLLNIYDNIKYDNLCFYAEQIFNLLIKHEYWFNLINNIDFKYMYIVNNPILFKDDIDNLANSKDDNSDLLVNDYYKYNILEFDSNYYVKKHNLFKLKYRYNKHLFTDLINCRISHNAFEFLNKYLDIIKTSIPQYYVPTLLYHNNYSINKYSTKI